MQLRRIISCALFVAALLPALPANSADPRGMEFDVYIRLREGMSEGELLERAGPPDYQNVSSASADGFTRTYYYYPTTSDPFTTIITVDGGVITEMKRERKF
ncbi:MAG TPA: hypothetical protein VHB46_06755 [Burkholderiales bacterium]|nr:hypothetical protein [Burkholderiales bacterium]